MLKAIEPSLDSLPNFWQRYFAATRPAFLSVTFVGSLLGLATAWAGGIEISLLTASLTIFSAMLAHAAANVLNDYYDSLNGGDAANTGRIFPFSGGSRMIQNGVLSLEETGRFSIVLLLTVIAAGLWLTWLSASGLLFIGLLGIFTGWAYSAPPCKLQSRGLGELGITLAWLLIVVGSDYVQRQQFSFLPIATGFGYSLLVANILYVNQFPDCQADALVGKRTLVVCLGLARAQWGYLLLAGASYTWLLIMLLLGLLPALVWLALLPIAISAQACRLLFQYSASSTRSRDILLSAIKLSILAALAQGILLTLALGWQGWIGS